MNTEQKAKYYLEKIKSQDKKINAFLHLNPNVLQEAKQIDSKKNKGRLAGKVIAIKSNISVKNLPITCASKTLQDYKGTYDATVIKKIKEEDGLIIGMTNMDEFAAGNSGESSAFNSTKNPIAQNKIPGGSSSGSAAAVAADFCDIALGSDTGGSIRNPASHCGVVGVKPSYGLVSRHGLLDLSMSLDQISPVTKNIDDAVLILDIIKGKDESDTTTFDSKPLRLLPQAKIKIGTLKLKGVNPKIQNLIDNKIKQISTALGFSITEIQIEHIDLAVQTYYPLVYVEFFSATRKYDGRRYGKKIEDACGEEVLRRILGGAEITKAEHKGRYYNKALQIKEIIKEEFASAFKKVDCIMLATVPILPRNLGEISKLSPEEIYAEDALTCPANLAEIPALSLPIGKVDNCPVGLQILCAKGQDEKMLSIAKQIEQL
ncbi:aspartyl/glutamyl-tRNA amidotransferase subunit A [Candidatus Pacearchaeota archaeon]|nr:aspartyl/glutamyl-tRNA amidotransferase subunit A [Candidatus Pacearchaeota archaeon]